MNKTKIDWADNAKYIPHGSRVLRKDGYVIVYCPEYPFAKQGKYVFEHRLVMANYIGRPLKPSEYVHHINGDRQDNRLENLQLTGNAEHRKRHMGLLTDEQKRNHAKGLVKYAESIRLPRELAVCACGCGDSLVNRDSKGRLRRFIHGHNGRNKHWEWGGKAV